MNELSQLMSEWKEKEHHRNKIFISDGIIDPKRWESAPSKVLLLLKEAYGEPDGHNDWDLCEVIRDQWWGPKYKVWWTAASWVYAAQHVTSLPPFPDDEPTWEKATAAFLGSAFINVKKSGGSSRSDVDDISSYAQQDGDLIKRQLELINPQIIICGNTWSAVKHLYPDAKQIYDLVWATGSRLVVDFWHPANQFPYQLNYYALACLLQNAPGVVTGISP